jgi:hypothetical protein
MVIFVDAYRQHERFQEKIASEYAESDDVPKIPKMLDPRQYPPVR